RVVVGIDLAVQRHQVAGRDDRQRIQLDQRQVLRVEQLVQAQHDLRELVDLLGIQAQRETELAALVGLQAFGEIHGDGVDVFRVFAGDLFDVDTTARRGNEGDGLLAAVDQRGEVQLFRDIGGFGDQHQVHRQRAAA